MSYLVDVLDGVQLVLSPVPRLLVAGRVTGLQVELQAHLHLVLQALHSLMEDYVVKSRRSK